MKPSDLLNELRSHPVPTSRRDETIRLVQSVSYAPSSSRRRTWLLVGATATVGAVLAFAPRISRDQGVAWAQVVQNTRSGSVTVKTTIFRKRATKGELITISKQKGGLRSFWSDWIQFRNSKDYVTFGSAGTIWKFRNRHGLSRSEYSPTTLDKLQTSDDVELGRKTIVWQGQEVLAINFRDQKSKSFAEVYVDTHTKKVLRLKSWNTYSTDTYIVDEYSYDSLSDSEFEPPAEAEDHDALVMQVAAAARSATSDGDNSHPFALRVDSRTMKNRRLQRDESTANLTICWGGVPPEMNDPHPVRFHNVVTKERAWPVYDMTSKECLLPKPVHALAGMTFKVQSPVPHVISADIPVFAVDKSQPIRVNGVTKGYHSKFVRYRRANDIPVFDCGDWMVQHMVLNEP